ncbi:hypothetical protein [Granulicella rosea]|uniref:hypothetical protein n=1 Tax=Granulicella rosea TaxID=474952 RepID=UPI001FEB3638|nr:hypothetical protein [Granulicella rosea]
MTSLRSGNANAANDFNPSNQARLTLVPAGGGPPQPSVERESALFELMRISSKKVSSLLAEAAVLVLVFALLDRLIVKDRMDMSWVAGALGISLALLAGSILLDFSARRWLRPQP